MNRLLSFWVILASVIIAACGGSNTVTDPGGIGVLPEGPEIATIELITSSPQIQSDVTGQTNVTLTALAKDTNNAVVPGVSIIFSADSGSLTVNQAITDANGTATATLSNGSGSPGNRTITVTATDGTVTATISVDVIGTVLSITGPPALAQNDTAVYTIVLEDSSGIGVAGETVDVTSANGNTLDATTLTTGVDGEAQVTLTATQSGADTLTVTALGLSAAQAVNVSDDSFAITAPAADTDIPLTPVTTTVTANWTVAGAPQVGETISFSSTRGTLSAGSAVTDGAGDASVTISSTTAGPALITATNPNGTTTAVSVEFVATTPATLDLQASPFTVGTGEQSEITAVVRDANFNLVKNQIVNFLIVQDDTNGFLSVASAITDSQGKATTFYTGGGVPGAENGVQISGTVVGFPAATNTVNLTVAREELDLVIGTGNDIFQPTTASFAQEWNVLVTDAVGNAVENKVVQVSLRSINYYKGFLVVRSDLSPEQWGYSTVAIGGVVSPVQCADEDANGNGILDIALGEDLINMSGQLEAGNVALVAPVPDTAPPNDPCTSAGTAGTSTDVMTNAQGIARVCVIWPQDHSWWVDAQIEALASVAGSEFSAQQVFLLPVLAEDIIDTSASPPNQNSPYGPTVAGTAADCSIPPPGLP